MWDHTNPNSGDSPDEYRYKLGVMDTMMYSIQAEATFDASWTLANVDNMIAAMRKAYRENTGQNWSERHGYKIR